MVGVNNLYELTCPSSTQSIHSGAPGLDLNAIFPKSIAEVYILINACNVYLFHRLYRSENKGKVLDGSYPGLFFFIKLISSIVFLMTLLRTILCCSNSEWQ